LIQIILPSLFPDFVFLLSAAGSPIKQLTEKDAIKQKADAAELPEESEVKDEAEKWGKDAITQSYLWPRMSKWWKENDIIVSETG